MFMFSSRSDFKILTVIYSYILDFINHIHYCIPFDIFYYFDFLLLTHFLFFSYLKIHIIMQ